MYSIESTRVKNEDGQGLLKVIETNGGHLFYWEKPILVDWGDKGAQYGIHTALLNSSQPYNNRISEKLRKALNTGSVVDIGSIKNELIDFLYIFSTGDYLINRLYAAVEEPDKVLLSNRFDKFDLEFSKSPIKSNEKVELQEYRLSFERALQKPDSVFPDIVDMTTTNIGVFNDILFMTKSLQEIDAGIVTEYEDLIKNGGRPYCLIFNIISENEHSPFSYVIDGHHKLMAYKNLNIQPHIIEINQLIPDYITSDEIIDLSSYLSTWQLQSVFESFYSDESSIIRILQSAFHPYRKFIRNGFTEEYWINGNLKLKGKYINHQPDGLITTYYENGQVNEVWLYDHGKMIRPVKGYYRTGGIRSDYTFHPDENSEKYIFYRVDKTISWENEYMAGQFGYIKGKISTTVYHENGRIKFEGIYKDGETILWRSYDKEGNLIKEGNS